MDPLTWTASSVAQSIIGQLLEPPPSGARLADKPISMSSWVVWSRGDKDIAERKVRKLVEATAKLAAKQNPPFQLISNEVIKRVAAEVTATLMALDQITMDRVQAAHLDPRSMVRMLEEVSLSGVYRKGHGEPHRLYDHLMIECCVQLVDYFTRRPEFLARTAVEHSKMLGKLLSHTEEEAQALQDYSVRYKKGVIALNQNVRLFGLGLPPAEQSYQLSTAYVSLSVQRTSGNGDHSRNDSSTVNENISLEDILASSQRVLLEGPAGAGKTTLLMRLALHICKGDLPGPISSWVDYVPFLLRLRTFFHDGDLKLPLPDEFASATTQPAPYPPSGWADSVLDSGKAVVLIDGIDEIPETFRPAVLEWIEQLSAYYPNAHYLITSRPAVLDEMQRQALHRLSFAPARLEPMTPAQVDEFIDRWHEAAGEGGVGDPGWITERANGLKDALLQRHGVSRLASNPLMCAMLCALNRNHNSSLPPGRIALYRAAFAMLLGRRDQERNIPSWPVHLTEDQAQALLANMAMWMTLNGRRTMSTADAYRTIEDVLPRLRIRGAGQVTLEEIVQYLLVRTGVLQEPVIGMLEFRHPSFQDYLAAAEALRGRSLNHLLRNAHDPLYHDVVIMAVGQSQDDPDRQRLVLGGLVERAQEATSSILMNPLPAAEAIGLSRSLWLLAAASIADVDMVDPDLTRKIRTQTKELLPPVDIDEAESVARAGEFVIDLLAELAVQNNLSAAEAAATARVASLVGGDAALMLLKRFRHHPETLVQTQIVDGWFRSRVPDRYADEVLADAALEQADVAVGDRSYIGLLPRLSRLRHLRVACSLDQGDLSTLAGLSNLKSLDLSDSRISNAGPLSVLKRLEILVLKGTKVWDLTPLAAMVSLKAVNVSVTPTMDLRPLSYLPNLQALDISGTLVSDLRAISFNVELETLDLRDSHVTDVSPICNLPKLESLDLSGTRVSSLIGIGHLAKLKTLRIARTPIVDLWEIAHLEQLQVLDIHGTPVVDLRPVGALSSLLHLDARETSVKNLSPLGRLSRLQSLDLMYCRIADLEPLADLTSLRSLVVRGTDIRDLTSLATLSNLRVLSARNTYVESVEPLRSLSHLEELDLSGTLVKDLSPLANLTELRMLDVVGTNVEDTSSLKRLSRLEILAYIK